MTRDNHEHLDHIYNTSMIPFDEIYENEDRSWSLRLVNELPRASQSDLLEISETLEHLADPRSAEPLLALVLDREQKWNVREAASQVLASFQIDVPGFLRKAWWKSADPNLMAHALRVASYEDAELIYEIASKPEHKAHCAALERLGRGFSESKFQRLLVNALSHSDADVRLAAAASLYQCTPIFAESVLLERLYDRDTEVVEEVLHTLIVSESVRVVEALQQRKLDCSGELKENIESTLRSLLMHFKHSLNDVKEKNFKAAEHLRAWMKPIEKLVESYKPAKLSHEEQDELDTWVNRKPLVRMSLLEFEKMFGDPDGNWAEKRNVLWRVDWDAFSADDRKWLANELLTVHPDPHIRGAACDPLRRWDEYEKLLALLHDPSERVRWSAALRSGKLARNEQFRVKLHSIFSDKGENDLLAVVAFESYLTHVPTTDVKQCLLEVVHTDTRDAIKSRAIYCLAREQEKEAIESLLPLLYEPAEMKWSVHSALIFSCNDLGIKLKGLGDLIQVDNLFLQQALAMALERD